MSRKNLKRILVPFLCLTMLFAASINTYAAISSTFYTYFVGGSSKYNDYKKVINSKSAGFYNNVTTTTASMDTLAGNVNTAKSFAAPNDMLGADSSCSYTIQGLCYNTISSVTYTLISAYSNTGNASCIFMSSDNTNWTKITVGSDKSHFGGIASTGSYTFIAGTNKLLRITDSALKSCYDKATSYSNGNIKAVSTLAATNAKTITLSGITASFLTYDTGNDLLWIGEFADPADGTKTPYIYAFTPSKAESASALSSSGSTYKSSIPWYSQGAAIRGGKLTITRSNVRTPDSINFVSELYCYDNFKPGNSYFGVSPSRSYMLPTMAEGIYLSDSNAYIVFESNSSEYYKPKTAGDFIIRCTEVIAVPASSI